MDEDHIARLHLVGLAQQILRGEALQQHRRRDVVGKALRQLDQPVLGDHPFLRVGAKAREVGHAVADLEVLDALADLDHLARAFIAGRERRRRGVEALAKINVNEIDADRVIADQNLATPRRRQFDVLDPHHLGAACFVNANSLDHVFCPSNPVCASGAPLDKSIFPV